MKEGSLPVEAVEAEPETRASLPSSNAGALTLDCISARAAAEFPDGGTQQFMA
jgi:hypothetical protein